MRAAAVTLCFLVRDSTQGPEVLLGLKKAGFGTGKIVGIGGHLELGESPEQAVCREVAEEVGVLVLPADLIPAGTVEFVFPAKTEWNMFATIFLARTFNGEATESDEIAPEWHPVAVLPHQRMWADAQHWLPAMLTGERLAVRVVLNDDNETVADSIAAVWSPAALT
ncbi:8-oxo-dGTP diphosphatase [Paenarthrobacter sp. Z7-10]|uniref:8-oxo-dGTP diphosphatase n=1 Tax=Paenarthrobacter sp. Z7-10 TaxID=2787635 RepID=UPI0022A9F4B8|nr:8-oxo-dGTP diphosphatase [Paenarthrobacter sp. Z7-10]MCZ2403510.1 8-oxo-dGTP diphosphatase [Paenarthrobacter sp. Z7-10]